MFILIDNYDSFTYNLRHYLGELGYRLAQCLPLLLGTIQAHRFLMACHPGVNHVVHVEEVWWTHKDLVVAHCFFSFTYVLKKPNGSQSPDSRSI